MFGELPSVVFLDYWQHSKLTNTKPRNAHESEVIS